MPTPGSSNEGTSTSRFCGVRPSSVSTKLTEVINGDHPPPSTNSPFSRSVPCQQPMNIYLIGLERPPPYRTSRNDVLPLRECRRTAREANDGHVISIPTLSMVIHPGFCIDIIQYIVWHLHETHCGRLCMTLDKVLGACIGGVHARCNLGVPLSPTDPSDEAPFCARTTPLPRT